MNKDYPKYYEHLQSLLGELQAKDPKLVAAFGGLHQTATAAGTIDTKTKELIALGIAIAVRCDGCISYHTHDALKAGAVEAEVVETIGVALLMGGGPALMYGLEAFEALKQFSTHK